MTSFLPIAQIIVAVLIIILILLQERSAGLSGIFGGDSGSSFYQTRRGAEKFVFVSTIILAIVFIALAVLQLVI